MIEFAGGGTMRRRLHPIRPRRDVRRIEGKLADVLATAKTDAGCEDYLHITLTDEGALLNTLGRLREVYPNVLHVERRFLQCAEGAREVARRREAGELELFRDFCREALGVEATVEELTLFEQAWREVQQSEVLRRS